MMIEKTVYDYLSQVIDVPVYMEEPKNKPDTFVVIEKTGSSKENYIEESTFALQSYATTLFKAAELNVLVKKAMDDLIVCPEVSRSKLNSDYNFTDDSTKRYRYQAIYDIVHY